MARVLQIPWLALGCTLQLKDSCRKHRLGGRKKTLATAHSERPPLTGGFFLGCSEATRLFRRTDCAGILLAVSPRPGNMKGVAGFSQRGINDEGFRRRHNGSCFLDGLSPLWASRGWIHHQ